MADTIKRDKERGDAGRGNDDPENIGANLKNS
jgi:hypothetical protein